MSTSKKEKRVMVGFRLKEKHIKELSARADLAGTRSHHKEAQKIVEAALDRREQEARLTRIELADLRAEVEAMRAGLIKILTGLVATSMEEANLKGEKMPLESARSFVQSAFKRGGGA